jgi:hypothetical protein
VSWRRDTQMIKLGMNYKFQSAASDDATGTPDDAAGSARAKGRATEDLAKASQNPVASLVSVPFQNNTNPNVGPFNRTQNVLNIEPVVPMSLNAQWNIISRTIIPVMSQPNPLIDSSTNGVGDISESLFFSPVTRVSRTSIGASGQSLRRHQRAMPYWGPARYCSVRRLWWLPSRAIG